MKYSVFVCLLAFTIVNVSSKVMAQSPDLQQGVSVQMATTSNAVEFPAADEQDAWIVTVTADGGLFFGVHPETSSGLLEQMKVNPRRRDQNLYIKADARAPIKYVGEALEAARIGRFYAPVLLTAQPASPAPGTVVPNGLPVLVGASLPAGAVATVVQLLDSGQLRPLLWINGDEISRLALEGTLRRHFQQGDEKLILLKADGRLPFEQVVQVIDTCLAAGAKVVLARSPSL